MIKVIKKFQKWVIVMSHTSFIKENIINITKGTQLSSKVYVAPEISEKLLNNVAKASKGTVEKEYLLAVVDITLTKSAKEGIYFTGEKLVIKELMTEPVEIYFKDIDKVTVDINMKKDKEVKQNVIHYKVESDSESNSGVVIDRKYSISESLNKYVNAESFAGFLNEVIESNATGQFTDKNQIMPLESMNDEVKITYVKILCNYAYHNDNLIDSKEYADIISFISKISVNSESRIELRSYMSDVEEMISNKLLLKELKELTKEVEFSIIAKSLMTDVISLYMANNEEKHETDKDSAIDDNFINDLSQQLEIPEDQIQLFIEKHKNDRDILNERLNDTEITKSVKDLSAKAASVGVPMTALYFSGAAGISAAGMTSGLATLGLGGILGFSSMFTGIGVLALIGITSYQGIKKVTGLKDEKNNSTRELMLQEIIKNNQRSLQYLIEDLNTISNRLITEVRKSESNSFKIEKLSKLLSSISSSTQEVADRVDHYESENVLTKAPHVVNKNTILELSNVENGEIYLEGILHAYDEDEEGKLKLRYDLSREEAETLIGSLTNIGYFNIAGNATAAVKSKAKSFMSR